MTHGHRLDRGRWADLCGRFGCAACDDHFGVLEAAYAEHHRHYHTALHVQECLDLLDVVRGYAERPAEIELAIWLHDVVYVPWRRDNEARSAALATEWLMACGSDAAILDRTRRLILSTRHREPPRCGDEALLRDIDLGILSAAPDRYDEYEAQVRREYRRVLPAIYRSRRRKILSSFMDRVSVYCTAWFLEHREQDARRNLERPLARLRGRSD